MIIVQTKVSYINQYTADRHLHYMFLTRFLTVFPHVYVYCMYVAVFIYTVRLWLFDCIAYMIPNILIYSCEHVIRVYVCQCVKTSDII